MAALCLHLSNGCLTAVHATQFVAYVRQAFLESEDFEDCIRNTVSIGGDTDTLGAISGAIAEAYYGTPYAFIPAVLEELPPDLRPILDKLDDLDWPLHAKDE